MTGCDNLHWDAFEWILWMEQILWIQTKELSILLSFSFHEVLQQLNSFIILYKSSGSKGSLFCDRGRLNFQAFVWSGI